MFSVLIASRGRPHSLVRTVRSLFQVERTASQLELVLVSSDCAKTDAVLPQLQDEAPDWLLVRLARAPTAGKSQAVNLGLELVQGEVIVFTDDDVEFARNYFAALTEGFRDRGADALQGGVRVQLEGPAPPWWTPYCAGLLADTAAYPEAPLSLNSCNVAVRGDLARTRWSHAFGPGNAFPFGADTVWSAQLRAQGGRFAFWPGMQVVHHVPLSRVRLGPLMARNFCNGRLSATLFPPSSRWFIARRALGDAWRACWRPRERTDSLLWLARRLGVLSSLSVPLFLPAPVESVEDSGHPGAPGEGPE